jgi:hypothetical protein
VCGQKIISMHTSATNDSSYYDIAKINENEFWAAGEDGILTQIDSTGKPTKINLPDCHNNFLKILPVQHFIFLFTDNGTIFRYDTINKIFIKKTFEQFQSKCFYDAVSYAENEIIVCGGATGISRHQKKIPKGFIAKLDYELNEPEILWKSFRKFVWSLELKNEQVLAAIFNGNNSVIKSSSNLKNWKSISKKIKGIVEVVLICFIVL